MRESYRNQTAGCLLVVEAYCLHRLGFPDSQKSETRKKGWEEREREREREREKERRFIGVCIWRPPYKLNRVT